MPRDKKDLMFNTAYNKVVSVQAAAKLFVILILGFEKHLRARFSSVTQSIIETTKAQFGQDLLQRCVRWRNPTSG